MKINIKRFFDSTTDLGEYIRTMSNHTPLEVKYNPIDCNYIVEGIIEVTIPEFHMQNLQDIAHDNELTTEQQNAIDYGISAIKTLIDMGVIK